MYVLVAYLVLLVFAALGICVRFCSAWSTPGAVSACCNWHMCYLCVCFVVLGGHQVLSVLAALGICVGYMWCL